MQKQTWSWTSAPLADVPDSQGIGRLARWGHYGTPLLLLPSAGGDFEEVERFHLVAAIKGMVESGRVKVFSVDGLAARPRLRGNVPPERSAAIQAACEEFLLEEALPIIHRDCHSSSLEILVAGAALGAMSAVSLLFRRPEVFRGALAMSCLEELSRKPAGEPPAALRQRFVQIASGEGAFEQPARSRELARSLTALGVPNHLDLWGPNYPHTWTTWREMLQKYVSVLA
jgi:esterase/lipase superfamily enzyme